MVKNAISDYSSTAASNTDVGGINIDEGMSPSSVNNAIRELMSHLADLNAGTSSLGTIKVDNLQLDGNAITSTDLNGNINITPNGTGSVVLDGINYPQADGTADYFLKTNGAGQLSFAQVDTASIAADAIDGTKIADDAIGSEHIADNAVGAAALNVTGNGTAGQVLKSDGDGSFTWADTAEPFTPTTVSGTTPSLDLGTYNYFSSGTLTGNTTLSFSNVPTAKRFFYDQTSDGVGNDFSSPALDSGSVDLSTEFSTALGGFVGNSGNNLYVTGRNAADSACIVYEYDLSTANDISTATTSYSFSLSSQIYNGDRSASDIKFKPDGTIMYIAGQQSASPYNRYIWQYTLSTAWDLSTASYASKNKVVGGSSLTFDWESDGTAFYFTDDSSGGVTPFTLSTAWDVSTATQQSNITTNLPSGTDDPSGIVFNSDGTEAIVTAYTNNAQSRYVTFSSANAYDFNNQSSSTTISFDKGQGGMSLYDSGKKIIYPKNYLTGIMNFANVATPYTLSFPASVQNSDYAATQSVGDRYFHEFVTTDGGTNVWLVGSTKYDDN